jgi:diguanylate cyclase (GGDEF)-like protein
MIVTLLTAGLFFILKLGYLAWFTPAGQEIPAVVLSSFVWVSALFALSYLLPGGVNFARWFNPVMLAALPITAFGAALLRPEPLHPSLLGAFTQLVLSNVAVHVLARASHRRAQRYARAAALAESAERLADTDVLTGLPNRRSFDRLLDDAIRRASRDDEGFCLVYLDLDGFKLINDTHGHAAGDSALQIMAARFRDLCAPQQIVARLSGDEFVVLVPGADLDTARSVAGRVLRAVREPIDVGGVSVRLTVSAGISRWPEHGREAHTLLRAADLAMYRVKRTARDGVEIAQTRPD